MSATVKSISCAFASAGFFLRSAQSASISSCSFSTSSARSRCSWLTRQSSPRVTPVLNVARRRPTTSAAVSLWRVLDSLAVVAVMGVCSVLDARHAVKGVGGMPWYR
ncbi:hypothetical protein ABIE67_000587 [Streptomyces sp. V4I8]